MDAIFKNGKEWFLELGGFHWGSFGVFCVYVLLGIFVGGVVKFILNRSAKEFGKTKREIALVIARGLAQALPFLVWLLFLKAGDVYFVKAIAPGEAQKVVASFFETALSVLWVLGVGYVFYCLVEAPMVWLEKHMTRTRINVLFVPFIRKSLRFIIVALALAQVAQVLSDKPLTSIVASLGIGGLALALAAQDTVRNFFGSLVLLTDRPFDVGERIIVNGFDGVVEEVGVRSTRIRTLEDHLVVFPNGELANQTIENIGKRSFIKHQMEVGVTYSTSLEKMREALDIIKGLLENHEGMREDFPPRAFFKNFNDFSLGIQVTYWYHGGDYWSYLAFNEEFNMALLKKFNDAGIEMAFPTQTVFLDQVNKGAN